MIETEGIPSGAADAAAWLAAAEHASHLRGSGPPIGEMQRLIAYADVEEVFTSRDFETGGRVNNAALTLHSLVSLSSEDHFNRRHVLSPLIRQHSLLSLERDVLAPATNEALCASVPDEPGADPLPADLISLCLPIFVRQVCVIPGIDGVSDPEPLARMCGYVVKFHAGANLDWSLRDHAQVLGEALDAKRHFIEEFFVPSWGRRESLVSAWRAGRLDESALPNDLLTLMIRNRDHYEKWDQDVFVREVRVFMSAGTQSPTNAVAHTVAELFKWLAVHPEDRARIGDDEFMRAALGESLRLHTGPPKIRRAIRDTRLKSGRQVRAGEFVLMDLAAANRDSAVFGERPDEFVPSRQMSETRPYGVAFGAGAHTCIGKGLSIGETRRGASGPMGTVVYVLSDLFAAGIELNPDSPPEMRGDTTQGEYVRLPVRFDRAALANYCRRVAERSI